MILRELGKGKIQQKGEKIEVEMENDKRQDEVGREREIKGSTFIERKPQSDLDDQIWTYHVMESTRDSGCTLYVCVCVCVLVFNCTCDVGSWWLLTELAKQLSITPITIQCYI